MRRNTLVCLALAVITFAVYWPVRQYGLIEFDDPEFVREKTEITDGLTWRGFLFALTNPVAANWHPVTTLSHMVDCQVFGKHLGPHHLVNVAIHALNGALVFVLLSRMTGSFWRGALVAGIFAWHPLRVESVAWIAERKDVLGGMFFLLALFAYGNYVGRRREQAEVGKEYSVFSVQYSVSKLWYVIALVLFALGLMSKPMVVTLPFILLLLDYWPSQRLRLPTLNSSTLNPTLPQPSPLAPRPSTLLWEKTPFFALAAAACWFTIYLQKGAMPSLANVSLHDRFANAIVSYLRYLGKMIWPTKLSIIYPHPAAVHPFTEQWPDWQVGLMALLLLAISVVCGVQAIRRPYLAVGWLWYLGTMIPVIGLVQVGEQAMADRYTYIPLIGPTIALVWLCAEVLEKCGMRSAQRLLAGLFAVLLLAACCVMTRHQLGYWHDTITLFSHAAAVTANNSTAEFFVGLGLEKQGDPQQAMAHYRAAIRINPLDPQSHYNLAQLLRKAGNLPEAAEHYEAALRTRPADVNSWLNLANVLPRLGRAREAIARYEEVLRLDPDSVEAANNLAWLLATSEEADIRNGSRAIQLAQHACELTQYKMTTLVGTLAAAYAEAGRFAEAVATEEKACALATASSEKELQQKNEELLELYRVGHSYRQPAESNVQNPGASEKRSR